MLKLLLPVFAIDYPELLKDISLEEAEELLEQLGSLDVISVPTFREFGIKEITEYYKVSLRKWRNELIGITGVILDSREKDKGVLICGEICGDLCSLSSDSEEYHPILFGFNADKTAHFDHKEGTWGEVYTAIVKHSKDNLTVPKFKDK